MLVSEIYIWKFGEESCVGECVVIKDMFLVRLSVCDLVRKKVMSVGAGRGSLCLWVCCEAGCGGVSAS